MEDNILFVLENGAMFDAGFVKILLHNTITNSVTEKSIGEVTREEINEIRNGISVIDVNEGLFNCYIQQVSNSDTALDGEDSNNPFIVNTSLGGVPFDPEYVYIGIYSKIEEGYYEKSLADLTKEDVEDIRCGRARVTENKDVFDSYLRQLPVEDVVRLFGGDDSADVFGNVNGDGFADWTCPENDDSAFNNNNTIAFDFPNPSFSLPDNDIFGSIAVDEQVTDSAIDTTNTQRVEKYMNNDDISEIYCVALAVMGLFISLGNLIDTKRVEKVVGHTLRKTFGLDKDRYNLEYKKKVQKAVEDMDHLVHSLRYKNIPLNKCGGGLYLEHKNPAYTLFANIFGSSYFYPYTTEKDDLGKSFDLVEQI